MKVYLQNLNSSAISSAAWDPETDILCIKFPSGACWLYHNVSFEMYYDLVHATSVGNFFNKYIRNNSTLHAQKMTSGRKELADVRV